ncbi:hypothetical protein CEK25_002364 [Fusarium fujikuroi]|nr:hypothetical protein CEK25_002364 [Fusarium fujikuroi]
MGNKLICSVSWCTQQMELICSEFRDTQRPEEFRFLVRTIERPRGVPEAHQDSKATASILLTTFGYNSEAAIILRIISRIDNMMNKKVDPLVSLIWAEKMMINFARRPDLFLCPGLSTSYPASRNTADPRLVPRNFFQEDQMSGATNRPLQLCQIMASGTFKTVNVSGELMKQPTKEDIEAVKATATISSGGADTTAFNEVQQKASSAIDCFPRGRRRPG